MVPVLRAHTLPSNWQLLFLNQRKEKQKNVAGPGIEPGTSGSGTDAGWGLRSYTNWPGWWRRGWGWGRLGRGRLIESCRNKIQSCTVSSMNWRCRFTKFFAIFLTWKFITWYPRTWLKFFFILCPRKQRHTSHRCSTCMISYRNCFTRPSSVMKISTKCNRCDQVQTMSEVSAWLACCHTDWIARAKQVYQI